MTYRVGRLGFGGMGYADSDPRITCDGPECDERIYILAPPPKWFLDGKAKRGWSLVRTGETRSDYCPACTRKRKAKP
jgi:hypothetical protein